MGFLIGRSKILGALIGGIRDFLRLSVGKEHAGSVQSVLLQTVLKKIEPSPLSFLSLTSNDFYILFEFQVVVFNKFGN
jgi:hypothetical protein